MGMQKKCESAKRHWRIWSSVIIRIKHDAIVQAFLKNNHIRMELISDDELVKKTKKTFE